MSISKTGDDLYGKERFAADGMATEAECQELIRLAKVFILFHKSQELLHKKSKKSDNTNKDMSYNAI